MEHPPTQPAKTTRLLTSTVLPPLAGFCASHAAVVSSPPRTASGQVNHDHSIDLTELKQALAALQIPFEEGHVKMLFEEIDADRSGSIDSEELYEALRAHGAPRREHALAGSGGAAGGGGAGGSGHGPGGLLPPPRREPNPNGTAEEQRAVITLKRVLSDNLSRVRDLFKSWDTDVRTIPEKCSRALRVPCASPARVPCARTSLCSLAFCAPLRTPTDERQLPMLTFARPRVSCAAVCCRVLLCAAVCCCGCVLRLQGDGQISLQEMTRALAALCIPMDPAAVKRLFSQIDTDGSGAIDFSELRQLLKMDAGDDILHLAKYGPAPTDVKRLGGTRSTDGANRERPRSSPAKMRAPPAAGAASTPGLGLAPAPLAGGRGGGKMARPQSAVGLLTSKQPGRPLRA